MPLFSEITVALVLAVVFGFAAHLLRQPAIIGFILAGVAVGYLAAPGLGGVEVMEGLAPIGVALLLFLVGLEMNFKDLRSIGWPALITSLGQVIITFGIGYLITTSLGFSAVASIYISIALTLSSTIIIVKLLSEKRELTTLYGRIVVGILLVQDLVAILVLIVLAGLQDGNAVFFNSLSAVLKGGILIGLTFFLSRFFPRFLDKVGRSPEMLYLFSIAWALGVASLTELIGLSVEMGGFLAGVALANSSEHFQIGSRLRPVRDFFLILFFVSLGARMLADGVVLSIGPAIVLSLFVLIAQPLIILILMGSLGYRARTSFLTGLTIAQISEFSLIIVALGAHLGHLNSGEIALVTLVGVVTIFASSYFIIYGDRIYRFLKPLVKFFEFRRRLLEEITPGGEFKNHIVLVGAHRTGYSVLKTLSDSRTSFVAVDFDPILVKSLKDKGVPVIYGDIADEEIQETINLDKARAVISTIPNKEDNLAILSLVRKLGDMTKVILTAQTQEDAAEFYKKGANYVIVPHFVGGWELAQALGGRKDFGGLLKLQERDIKVLDLRGLSGK